MPLDDSIPNDSIPDDESTANHRDFTSAADAVGPVVGNDDPDSSEVVAQANTVIRGSSRVDRLGNSVRRSPVDVTKVLLGQQLNQYLIEDLIGGGGMGAVFRAHDQQLDRTVAIKVIPFVGDDVELQRRFRNEAQSAAKLDDPRIARVYDAGNHDEWHYIVFEFVEGTNIRDQVVDSGVYTIDDAVYHTSQLAGAIQHLADRGIVHRDIKPSNVIISSDGPLKLVDMGLARSEHLEMSDDMTASGVTLGTFDYISPEQARDPRNADLRSDIYSLGCTLFFMLTGSPPFPGGTMAQKLISHGTAPPPDVQILRPEVSHHLTAVLNKMLAKSPADRYGNANDLLSDLREVASRDSLDRSYALAPVSHGQTEYASGRLYEYSPWIAAFAVLLVSVGWLRLESASHRDEITIQAGAMAPRPVSLPRQPEPDPTFQDTPLTGGENQNAEIDPSDPSDRSIDQTPLASLRATDLDGATPNPESFADDEQEDRPSDLVGAKSLADNILPPTRPRVIRLVDDVLTSQATRDESGAALTNSFPEAVRMARQFGAGQIEITSPLVRSKPVRIGGSEPLIIRSTVGGSTILFQSDTDNNDPVVSIATDRIEFEGLHFVWENERSSGIAPTFFGVRGNRQLRMNHCSVTIKNRSRNQEAFCFNVSAASSWQAFGERFRTEARLDATLIEIRNTVIRGQMSMLSLDGNANLELAWDNGLLAITGRMLEATGAQKAPGIRPGRRVEMMLTRLTAHTPRGLIRTSVSDANPYPIAIDRQSLNSLFLVDSGRPQIEMLGSSPEVNLPALLRVRGTSNAYCVDRRGSELMLRTDANEDSSQNVSVGQIQDDSPSWFQESSPRWIADPWIDTGLNSIAITDRTAEDYQQADPSSAGFDLESLQPIPQIRSDDDGSRTDRLSNNRETSKKLDFTGNPESDLTFRRSLDLIGEALEANVPPN